MASKNPTAPPPGYIRIYCPSNGYVVTALLGDGANPVPYREQIIEDVDIDRDQGLNQWKGSKPMVVEIPVLLDEWSGNNTVERPSKQLDIIAGRDPNGTRPLAMKWNTAGVIPYDYRENPEIDWLIVNIERPSGDSTSIIRSQTGNRRREALVLSLKQQSLDEYLTNQAQRNWEKRVKARARASDARRYRVVKGDTFVKIAKKKLRNSRRWKEIANLNGRRSNTDLKVGERINLP